MSTGSRRHASPNLSSGEATKRTIPLTVPTPSPSGSGPERAASSALPGVSDSPLRLLPLDVVLDLAGDPRPGSHFPGSFARGLLVSALHHSACYCEATREPAAQHRSTCPLATILGTTPLGARRYAVTQTSLAPERMEMRVVLYGLAARSQATAVVDAMADLQHHGIGHTRIPVRRIGVFAYEQAPVGLQRIQLLSSSSIRDARTLPDPLEIRAPWTRAPHTAAGRFRLELLTPLDLSWKSARARGDVTASFSFDHFLDAITRRWVALTEGEDAAAHSTNYEAWRHVLRGVQVDDAVVGSRELTRFSARQRRTMPMSGLVGYAHLTPTTAAQAAALIDLGRIAPFLTVGARTPYGFGAWRLVQV